MTHIDELLASGDDASMQAAALHSANCGDCAALLADWNDLSTTARDLRTTWSSDTLWPRIERKLRSERGAPRTRWMQIAAAVAIMIALGVMSAVALREHNEQRDFEKRIYADNVMNDVEKAEQAHVAAIERLEKLADPKLEQPGSPLMVSYKEKLVLLDDAIAECQTNIERNRRNAHLRRQLLAIYDAKQQTLHDVLREETHVSNP